MVDIVKELRYRWFQFTRSSRSATFTMSGLEMKISKFQFTRSSRSATPLLVRILMPKNRFNSRAPRGARPRYRMERRLAGRRFNSRAPRGARLKQRSSTVGSCEFQFTRSSRSATDVKLLHQHLNLFVSIHALLAERDVFARLFRRDPNMFQFTRSSRSATAVRLPAPPRRPRFNSRAPRGARQWYV